MLYLDESRCMYLYLSKVSILFKLFWGVTHMNKIKRIVYDLLYWFINYFIGYFPLWTIRKWFYKLCGLKIGKGSRINMGCILMNPWNIVIGSNTIINEYTLLMVGGGVHIGDNCSISMFSILYSASHYINSEKFEYYEQRTVIKDNVWVGARAVILAGSVVNTGCIIGANSMFNLKESDENCIYGGVPAKLIKIRNIDSLDKQHICMFFR